MKVTNVTIRPVRIPRKESFGVRTGKYDDLPNVYVAVYTDEGITGFGEAAPIADYFGETQETIVETLKNYLAPVLIGKDPSNIRECIHHFDRVIPGNPCAKASLDIALHDIKGKLLGIPVSSLLGGRLHNTIPLACSIGLDEPKKMAAKVRAAQEEGFSVIKLKGGQNIVEDINNLRIARDVLGADGPWLRLDANGGYVNRTEVFRYIPEFESLRLIVLEQPFPPQEWDALRALRDRIRVPILLDESMQTGWDFHQLVLSPEGFVPNIKVQKSGGLFKSSQMVAMAEQFQIPVMIGSQRESQIGNTAGIHLASIIGRHDYPCDVRYAFAVKEGFNVVEHIPSVKQGRITVPDEPGLGIDVLWDRSEALAVGTFKVP